MFTRRKVLIITGALILFVIAALIFLLTNINWIVKTAIEKYGSQAAGTAVRVSSVSIGLTEGKATIEGLTVANPKGFTAPHILSLGSISVRILPRSVSSDPLVIENISITEPRIAYEMNGSRVSNIDLLKKNIAGSEPKRSVGDKKEKARRIRIRKLVIERGRAEVRVTALGDSPRTVMLKKIEVTDIGGQAGETPDQVAKQILNAVVTEAGKEVSQAGVEVLMKRGLEQAVRDLQNR